VLVLFDIDATLVSTSRAGVEAMGAAGRRMFGQEFDHQRVEYAGRLDPLIIADLLSAHDLPAGPDNIEAFRAGYAFHLERALARPGRSRALPGVRELLNDLARRPDVTIGLLTGNYPETGAIKIQRAGIEPERFDVRVWGSDSPHDPPAREHLPPVGMRRYAEARGVDVSPENVVIIGDTVHDVACALAHDCRVIGVATGSYTTHALQEAGAHLSVDTLSDTESLARWILEPR
jgi:phosphoglycolate phosphatase-like HAD superfamily hydrolase